MPTDSLSSVSPETQVRLHEFSLRDAWDFEEVLSSADTSDWHVGSGCLTQWKNLPHNMMVSESAPLSACVKTRVYTDDSGFSGIVFRYQDPHNYFVFEGGGGLEKVRLRWVQNGESSNIASATWTKGWLEKTKLMVCFEQGNAKLTAYMDDELYITAEHPSPPPDGRVGIYNHFNDDARHSYLRILPYDGPPQ